MKLEPMNTVTAFAVILRRTGKLSDFGLLQLRLLYDSISRDGALPRIESMGLALATYKPKDETLFMFLLLLLAEAHRGSILLPNRGGEGVAEAAGRMAESAAEFPLFDGKEFEDDAERARMEESLLSCASPEAVMKAAREIPGRFTDPGTLPEELIVMRRDGWSFSRLNKAEETIKGFFASRHAAPPVVDKRLKPILDEVLGSMDVKPHWRQGAAVAVACCSGTSIISGGPGTGKTTVVAQVLRALCRLDPTLGAESIALAAPTGRAAARMQESIARSLGTPEAGSVEEKLASLKGSTLHRLMGFNPSAGDYRHGPDDPLLHRLIIVDEVSMIDVHLFAAFLSALQDDCRLILLGDRDQLPSVDAGAILGDLTNAFYRLENRESLSAGFAGELERLLKGIPLETDGLAPPDFKSLAIKSREAGEHLLRDRMVILTRSHRFKRAISGLASAINEADTTGCGLGESSTLVNELTGIIRSEGLVQRVTAAAGARKNRRMDPGWETILRQWAPVAFPDEWKELAKNAFRALGQSGQVRRGSPEGAGAMRLMEIFDSARILCPLRDDTRGVGVTNAVMKELAGEKAKIFPGMPILITANAHAQRLYNGDTGVIVKVKSGHAALFPQGPDFTLIPLGNLPEYDLAYAMTVHKSQGSEYGRVLLAIPERDNPLLTREIIFTAVTRSRTVCEIYGWERALMERVLKRTIHRESGLLDWL
ncbi:MAG: exodeoxyribonuclease V subunit alpha [Myxococcota bacterium]|jgi:exodeoxyribonuclease V alpha subunit